MKKKEGGKGGGIAQKVPMEQFNPKEHGHPTGETGGVGRDGQPGGAATAHEGSYNLLAMEEKMHSHHESNSHLHPVPMHNTGHFHGGKSGSHTPHNVEEY